nr:5838_t:CDS:2 [Entrophospora candida]
MILSRLHFKKNFLVKIRNYSLIIEKHNVNNNNKLILPYVYFSKFSYSKGLELQNFLVEHHKKFNEPSSDIIILLQHPPTYTLSVRSYVASIEKLIIDTCSEYEIKARTTKDTGVWVENEKICAIGIQVQRFITSHGFALNCNTDLRWFDHIIPCGIEGKSVTSITKELNKRGGETNQEISAEQVLPILFKKFNTLLGGGDNGVAIRQLMPLNELSHIEIYNKLNIEIKKIAK